jgi:iron(III) transport system substrate-binding protein
MRKLSLLLFSLFIFTACAQAQPKDTNEINIYSARNYDVDKDLLLRFESETGIKVNLFEGKGDELIERLKLEKTDPIADIFMTVGAETLYPALQNDLLDDLDLDTIQASLDAKFYGDKWVALTKRARIIVYDKVNNPNPPVKNLEDLTDPQYRGTILSRSSTSSYNLALMANHVQKDGYEATQQLAQGLVNNFARTPTGNDRDQAKSVIAGLGQYAIMNTYYVAAMERSADAEEVKVAQQLGLIYPEQTHVNISWIAKIKNSPNPDNAQRLIEFLLSAPAQQEYANRNGEYPALNSISVSSLLLPWDAFNKADVDYETLGQHSMETIQLFDEVGWK